MESPPWGELEDQPEGKLEVAVFGLIDLEWSHPPVEADEDQEDNGPFHEGRGQRVRFDQPPGRLVGHYLLHNPPYNQSHTLNGEDEPEYAHNIL